jgi:hypothetical protein
MQFYYDGQIKRYVTQLIRMLSGFKYQTGDGTIKTIPILYGDLTRQVSHIIRENSENKIPSMPRMALHISNLQLDRSRISDSTFISKMHLRERDYDPVTKEYLTTQGSAYTVERLMPTPYQLSVKVDIWTSNTDQKLQIMEQIMMLFNPSLEIQTTDNYIDWASLSVVELKDITFSSRTIPVGVESEFDVATLVLDTPIWISPPTKVKRLGVIHSIIANIYDGDYNFLAEEHVTIGGFDIFVYFNKNTQQYYADLLDRKSIIQVLPLDQQEAFRKLGDDINWRLLLDQYGRKFRAGSSQIFLKQSNGFEIVGTVAINELDETKLIINFDQDTFTSNDYFVNAIINPMTFDRFSAQLGSKFIILDDIRSPDNDIPSNQRAWPTGFEANTNDIIEFDGTEWRVVFDSNTAADVFFAKNNRTGVQYKFENSEWVRSFEGEYRKEQWKLIL